MKKTLLAIALTTSVGTVSAATMTSATFSMFDGTNGYVGGASDVTGSIGGGTFSVASATPFFGLQWTAHDGITFGPGTYSFDTSCPAGTGGSCGGTADYVGIVVGAGQVGGHILFDWGVVTGIDVINVWDVVGDTYTSTDVIATTPAGPDGILGLSMIDGAFVGFNANFDFVAPVPVPAAVWLFGSGLLGLVGVARRKAVA
jgi:hypothetical protein